ncbi:hypothetical protein [Bradyrhizobium sp. SZCCHNRI1009]|uniref:hypothetical protein n=1 Tax=Bradyrhizobium sp. SZCCHNRI1009 TaxID=3057277 RepID=UPI0029164001|nr:hypothetical protein [Bradyrhizobium sp. SZCCHNRI1009]
MGVLLLGRQFLQLTTIAAASSLLLASVSKKHQEILKTSSEFGGERPAANARGLSFVVIGILLQMLGAAVDLKARAEVHGAIREGHAKFGPEIKQSSDPSSAVNGWESDSSKPAPDQEQLKQSPRTGAESAPRPEAR